MLGDERLDDFDYLLLLSAGKSGDGFKDKASLALRAGLGRPAILAGDQSVETLMALARASSWSGRKAVVPCSQWAMARWLNPSFSPS
jgi:hypothetical protein